MRADGTGNRAAPDAARVAAVSRAIDVMRVNLWRPVTLTELARIGMFSPFYFHRIFRDVTAVTPARFLTALRMAEARRLLGRSALPIADISIRAGYTSLGTFTTQFTRLVGLPPGRFRGLVRSLGDESVGARLTTLRGAWHAATGATMALCGLSPPEALAVGRLFPAGRLSGWPDRWTLAGADDGGRVHLPEVPGPGEYAAFTVVVPARARLAEALVGDVPEGCLVGRARVSLTPESQSRVVVRAILRDPHKTDFPALSVTPLAKFVDSR